MTMSERLYWLRLDAALIERRASQLVVEFRNVKCTACLENIANYIGPKFGILCSRCLNTGEEGGCTRIEPLVITRGTLRY
jgi:hypothetical protein